MGKRPPTVIGRLAMLLVGTAGVALIAVGWAPPAFGDVGIGIQADAVVLQAAARPGSTYELPAVYVVDNGTQPETVSVTLERLSKDPGITVPRSWVRTVGPALHLQPKQSGHLRLALAVPSTARAGTYFTDLVATAQVPIVPGHPNFGAAAATKLEFTVTTGGSWWPPPPWVWGMAGGAAVVVLGAVAVRRSGLRIRIDRSPPAPPASSSPVPPASS